MWHTQRDDSMDSVELVYIECTFTRYKHSKYIVISPKVCVN